MKIKRIIFILVLFGLFVGCYSYMNSKFDKLARYPYTVNEEDRRAILEYLTDDEIEFLVSQKIQPEQFLSFIRIPGFEAKNTLFYDVCLRLRPMEPEAIVQFVNTYRNHFALATFEQTLATYGYETLASYYVEGYSYLKGEINLVPNPNKLDLVLDKNSIVYQYVPNDLVVVDHALIPNVPREGESPIYYRSEVNQPLLDMLGALTTATGKTNGDLILTSGYVSYPQQVQRYSTALIAEGPEKVKLLEDVPGASENQLGYTVGFIIANSVADQIEQSEQITWMNENAHKYGFIVRYPKGMENKTGKNYQPLTLRYVGKDIAKNIYETKKTLDDVGSKE